MNEFDDKTSSSGNGIEGLREEVQSLRTMLSYSLFLIFIFSLCMNIYLMRQTSLVTAQAGQESVMLAAWSKNGALQESALQFWTRLNDFGRTHPAINPILGKYGHFFGAAAPLPPPVRKK
jgi:hypothetical protein